MRRMRTEGRRRALAYTALVLAALFWAGNAVLARAVVHDIRPFALAFWRWVLALLILLPFGAPHLRRGARTIREQWLPLFWLGGLSVGAYNSLLYVAAHTTTAINITLVGSTMPVAIAVLARYLLGQRAARGQLTGFLAAGAGMLVIVARGEWGVLAELAFREGDLLMVAAVLVWGIYSVLLRVWRIAVHPVGFLTVTVVVGVLLLFPLFLWELAAHGHFAWRPVHLPLFAYLAVFPSILAFLFWNNGVAVVGPSQTGMFIYLVPVFTAALAYPLLGEALHPYHAAGGLLILCGLFLATRSAHRTASDPPAVADVRPG
jgi:drug/metabolite transporter (DMT)-like permease